MTRAERRGDAREAIEVRVRGLVQGVGFRPHVLRIARQLGLGGDVRNDASGVVVRAAGSRAGLTALVDRIVREAPPLARVDGVESRPIDVALGFEFHVAASVEGAARTQIAPDAVACAACSAEVADPASRRFRYPFTTCTHCGPRLSVVRGVPYDRGRTTLAGFPLCPACAREYDDPTDRRFHAEATACPACGPRARLVRFAEAAAPPAGSAAPDDVDAAIAAIARGEIVALKGLGGYQLVCDATRADSVCLLRARKHRDARPFALMARDLDVVRRVCAVDELEADLLRSVEGPVVLLDATGPDALPREIAPGLATLGFMLPTTPLHAILLRDLDRPVVMTSGNVSGEPQVIDDAELSARLGLIADVALTHDRPIASRLDDSVARVVDGRVRLLRRARGYAPRPLRLPEGFEVAPAVVAYGADLKSTFCLVRGGEATLSQHQGDLDDLATLGDYERSLAQYLEMLALSPAALAADRHPAYASSTLARARAKRDGLPLVLVQHHHAHAAACLAENGYPLEGPPVLAIVLDGIGYGDDGEIWGGELLVADYRACRRAATLRPTAMLGGDQASREPWRNLYAQLVAAMGWSELAATFGDLELVARLAAKPRATLDGMLRAGVHAPLASSCGRLFDAVAAATGVVFERQAYEGQAGALLEALVDRRTLDRDGDDLAYPMTTTHLASSRVGDSPLACVDPREMWRPLLSDLAQRTPLPVVSLRFHRGLARAVVDVAASVARRGGDAAALDTVALSGGCFQNRVLFEEVSRRLAARGLRVLSHARVPPNDGGIALGQAAVAAARLLRARS
ncbi:MAG TPA: carbamoyltransferase HypF [Byssovorax sp.]